MNRAASPTPRSRARSHKGFLGLGLKETLRATAHAHAFAELVPTPGSIRGSDMQEDSHDAMQDDRHEPEHGHEIDVIVIGGSAGALEALLGILPALPSSFSIPVVVVLHLAPNRPSLLPDVLARACALPVCEAEDKQPLQRGGIHVAPPNYHLLLERDRSLALSVAPPVHFSRPSIDLLFESAAASFGRAVAGIVLSGANEDGAHGLRRIVEAGGLAAVEDPAIARHAEMPGAALRGAPGARALSIAGLATWCAGLAGPDPLHEDAGR